MAMSDVITFAPLVGEGEAYVKSVSTFADRPLCYKAVI
jgi:hypothetical protein